MKFYKRDPNAAIAGMAELTMAQRGAYNSVLDLLYAADGDLPDDDLRVARMMSCHWREWAALKRQLIAIGKVWIEDGKLCARRVQETVKEAADFSQEQRRRASKGWQERKKAKENNDEPVPTGNANTATATPTEEKEEANASSKKTGTRVPEDFWPNETSYQRADALGIPITPDLVNDFLDYWRAVPGAKGRKLDWQATFRNYLVNFASRSRGRTNGQHKHSPLMEKIGEAVAIRRRAEEESSRESDSANLVRLPLRGEAGR